MRILSVDDQQQNLRLMEMVLRRAGHEVVSASNGVEALDHLRRQPFDLIISDILMPRMDGFQLCREVKQDAALNQIPLIFYTASFTDEQDEALANNLGAARFVIKPTEPSRLLEIIQEVLSAPGKPAGPPSLAGDEQTYLRSHNERLVHKLEQKVAELSALSSRLQSELDERTRETAARARAEAILRETETRYRVVAEQTGRLIYDYDVASGRIIWHGAITQLTGWAPEEFQAVDLAAWAEMIHAEDRPRALSQLEAVLKSGDDHTVEYRFRRKDGSHVHVDDHATVFQDAQGKVVRLLGTMGDITSRVRAEQNLRESEALHHSLVDNLPLGLFVKGTNGKYTFANPRYSELTGLPLSAVLGCTDRDLLPATRAAENQAGDDVVLRTGTPFQTEETYRRRDGVELTLHVFKTPVRDAAGRVVGLQGMLWDVTEQKRTETARAQLESQLWQSQKMEALGNLAGGIAHDFNNILAAILLNVDLLDEQVATDTEARGTVKEIRTASLRAREVVRQILSFSRQPERARIPLPIQMVTEEAAHLLRATLPSTIEIQRNLAADCPPVLADPAQIHQVLISLATNAAYALRERGGLLEITLQPVELADEFARAHPPLRAGPHLCLSVTDTGCGMDAATQERIFEPYFTTKPPGEGTGLGLSVVHGIVRSHEGAITVTSAPGKGACFRIFLPVYTSPPPATEPVRQPVPPGKGERILFVDDETSITRVGETMLRRLGYQPMVFTDPELALAAFRKDPNAFDLVLTDLTMPRMTGVALAGELQRIRKNLPVVLATGYMTTFAAPQAAELGIAEVLGKPFSAEDLARTIARVLHRAA